MILLDTHAALWLALAPERLSRPARRAIGENTSGGLAISAQSLYETAWLTVRKRIAPSEPLETFIRAFAAKFRVYPLTPEIAIAAAQLPSTIPSDPSDRIICATALVEDIALVTAEQHIRKSSALRTIW